MNHLDLFSGIGGFHLAGEMVWGKDFNTICHIEIDPFCQKVLKKHWPHVPIYGDIRTYKHDKTKIDLLTGGFPCQPFSCAGKRKGKEDDRYLWPAMLEIIKSTKPTWVIGENVSGIKSMEFDHKIIKMENSKDLFKKTKMVQIQRVNILSKIIEDLENIGYELPKTKTGVPIVFIIPACSVDALHRRDRVWIIAYSNSKCINKSMGNSRIFKQWSHKEKIGHIDRIKFIMDCNEVAPSKWRSERYQFNPRPILIRNDDGIPNRVDRLRALGNAIVPQCVVPIMQAIKEIEDQCK